jgi:hypothetical protein
VLHAGTAQNYGVAAPRCFSAGTSQRSGQFLRSKSTLKRAYARR